MEKRIKKIFIIIILGVYLLTIFLQNGFYAGNRVYAANVGNYENQEDYTNIVAIIVNEKLYNSNESYNNRKIKDDIEWYATEYIQGKRGSQYNSISNSKALVFPINTENFSTKNIVQLLENIYFDGIKGESSRLVGLILVGDIPLPVVNQKGYIYPTIYPYVDFEDQKFIWDEKSKYFVYNNNPKGQAEIWHGMINFGENVREYIEYFSKLRQYFSDPESYIGKSIWYEDFIGNNKYFNDNSLNFYLNNFIFAEDLGYHRYSDLLVKVLQGQRNSEIAEIMEQLSEINSGSDLGSGVEALAELNDNMNTPTMQIKSLLDNGYLSTYSSLFGQKYLKTITNNIETANRWIESRTGLDGNKIYLNAFDSVYKKAEVTDEVLLRREGNLEPFLVMINNALEEAVDKKVEEEKYRLNEVLPLTYLKYEGRKRFLGKCVWEIYDAYENFFYGTNAKYVKTAEETSTYRGTFRNYIGIDGLTMSNIQNSQIPSTDVSNLDLNKKSIGGSYEIFATQVDANRGYNYNNSLKEYEIYSGNKTAIMNNWDVTCVKRFLGICIKRRWNIVSTNGSGCDLGEDGDQGGCESPTEYAMRIWGGASSLNLDMNGIDFSRKSGYSYTGATSSIFDIAGSVALPLDTPEYESNSFQSVDKYSNLILRRFSPNTRWPKFKSGNPLKKKPDSYGFGYDYSMDYEVKFTNMIPEFDGNHVNGWRSTGTLKADDVDYFEKYSTNPIRQKEGDIIKIQKYSGGGDESCQGAGEIYTYKTLDSRVKNDSVNADEVNGKIYKIFQDDSSHVKQFYMELLNYLDAISGSVNLVLGSDTGSLIDGLQFIKRDIDDINGGFQSIIDFDLDRLDQMDTGSVLSLARIWANTFNISRVNVLLSTITGVQDNVLNLKGFVEFGDTLFDGVIDFVEEQKKIFQINGWDLIFLVTWKHDVHEIIKGILDNYKRLKIIITEAGIMYGTINEIGKEDIAGISVPDFGFSLIDNLLSMNVVENLSGKREDLATLLNGSGCDTKYKKLCEAIDVLIDNYEMYVETINEEKKGINTLKIQQFDDDGNPLASQYEIIDNIFADLLFNSIFTRIDNSEILDSVYDAIRTIPQASNGELTGFIPGMNMTTSDRPIDSPRYLTFKGIGGDKVTFIYPDIYKSEIFSGDSNVLLLKSTGDIEKAIRSYLMGVVDKYNAYLQLQSVKSTNYYNANVAAYNLLDTIDSLATPNHKGDDIRPYNLFSRDYLINELENAIRSSPYFSGEELAQNNPIGFIASMIYLQNVARQIKTISGTIQGDFDNQRMDFDVNEKISYLMDNYLVTDNNQGNYLTPDYRSSGYEVAFINSDGNDRIMYENTPNIVNTISSASNNYIAPSTTNTEATPLEVQLLSECNIPMDQGVLIFDMSNGRVETPWFDALRCRREQIKEKPFELKITFPFTWDTGSSTLDNLGSIFNWDTYQNIGETYQNYINQRRLLDMDDANDSALEDLQSSNPGAMADLQEILSYTLVNPKISTVSADNPKGEINITSSKQLGDVEFNIVNVGGTKIKLFDGNNVISNNITIGTGGFSTGRLVFDPYNQKILTFEMENPQEGLNVVIFYLCLPGTQNCVKRSFRLDVVPGEVKNIEINLDRHVALEGASVPFDLKGTDAFGNEIGELISQKFETSVSSGILNLNGAQGQSIKISNFKKTNFYLIATGGDLDGKTIDVQVSGSISGIPGIKATEYVNVKKGRIDVYSGNVKLTSGNAIITGFEIKLPDEDIYFTNDQPNIGTIPHLTFRLVDKNGNLISIDGKVSVKMKNGILTLGNIVVKEGGNGVTQYKFNKTKTFDLSGGVCNIYLSPNFLAGDDVLYVSMDGIDSIELPVIVKHASAKILSLSADNTLLDKNSITNANLKVFDNWKNIIDDEIVSVTLGSVNDRISLSRSGNMNIETGSYDFQIHSVDKGGLGYVYAYIRTTSMSQQSPDVLSITIQEKMLPENDLNVMYLNLFGNDRGNQWGYMSDNKKYSESLIKNSDKLIAVTTQLLGLENIKYYPIVVDSGLQINNLIGNDIFLELRSGFVFDIDQVGTISVNLNSFLLEEVVVSEDEIEQHISSFVEGRYKNKNVLFYIPEQPDSIIESNGVLDRAIYINGHKVFDIRTKTFDKNLTISLGYDNIAGYQVWQVFFDTILIGKILFAVGNKNSIYMDLNSKSSDYLVGSTWINGSSNEYGLGFYEIDSSLSTKTFGYKSIQDSYDSMLGIGFTADFKNITNFGGGMSVGEATLPFGSELLINIGDPLLKRVDGNESAKIYDESGNVKNDTEFDLGLGEVIYSDPNKEIFKVINIDFNNDKLEDIIVIYKDGTVNLLKNYGGTNPFQNLGVLMTLAERISDVSVGDVDGNGYQDILVWTAVGGLRVYLNNKGIFDVDGYPVCINVNVDKGEISEHPEKISGIHQIFLKDMDLDGALDIVTNDKFGFVKIFYGGNSNGVINYISTNKYMCDENWYTRIQNNSKIIYKFGVKIDSSLHVLDQSLIRWKGIDDIGSGGEISMDNVGVDDFNPDSISLDNIGDLLGNITNFDVSAAEGIYGQVDRFQQAGFGVIPVYESGIESEGDINYVEIGALTGSDPVKVYKVYEDMNHNPIESNLVDTTGSLMDGDLVRVSVYIFANQDFTGTYIDRISGPWIIPLSEYDDAFENFWFDSSYIHNGYITSGQINNITENIHWDLGSARYMLDNISMKRGDRLKFSYGLLYNEYRVFDIDIDSLSGSDFSGMVFPTENLDRFSHDKYPDIYIQPTDGCNDSMFVFFNNGSGNRDYTQKFMDLGALTAEYYANSESNSEGTIAGMTQTLSDSVSDGDAQQVFDDVLDLAGGIWETIDWKGMLSSQGLDLTNLLNAGTQFIDASPLANNIVKKIDDTIGSACNGFSLGSLNLGGGSACGLPVPFNQAFLGPGKYHVFGCYNIDILNNLIGDGMPVLNIPGNWPSPAGYLPAPGFFGYPAKAVIGDDFSLGNPIGTNQSFFRVYVMPTLTMGIGFAMCFGPYTLGENIKDPWGSIAGNCVVFAVTPPCGGSSGGNEGANSTMDIPSQYTFLRSCNKQNNPLYLNPGESSTPFILGGASPNSNTILPVIPQGTYAGGFINIEVAPEAQISYREEGLLDIEALTLRGGASTQNTIRGSKEQGLIQRIVKQWLDKQIKYIMTTLTNFKISIIWPDLEALLGKKAPSTILQEMGQEYCDSIKGERIEGDAAKDRCNGKPSCCKETEESQKIKCEDRGKQRDSQSKKCIKKISQNFEDESLASIDSWTQQNLLSREQIASWSDYNNPFKELEKAFSETPLINISTQDIVVNVPMLTSEDITSYISMSQNWVNRQKEILEEWQVFFKSVIGVCGGSTSINGISDLKNAIDDLKEQYKEMEQASNTEQDEKFTENLQGKIDALERLKTHYNLDDLGEYKIYESKSGGFYVYTKFTDINSIEPYDVYLYFDPGRSNLSMFTRGFDLITSGNSSRTKISIKRNNEKYSNDGLNINKDSQGVYYSCAEIFLDGTIDEALKGFLNIQSSADSFMISVKQNIETLQQYKLFPLQLYDWIHVVERYLGDISNLVNSVLGTLSIWMETNANRYSQYVDAIITIMTTLETYQLIIDFSADWTEKCSTCTNDNYDQFSCKLGKICDMLDIELPVIEIPPTKIPSIYLDFSEINISMDINFPNFVFNSVPVSLPELPNLPTPPNIDLSLDVDSAFSAGLEYLAKQMKMENFGQLASISFGNIPLLPSPPTLPELPSFIPEVQMELPLLPPAPKIPELPNSIKTSIESAKVISKILCIVKGKFGLVGEKSIKAKVEQITQRTYEVPFFDNFDLTLSDRNANIAAKLPSSLASVFTGFSAVLGSNQFKDVKLQGFDLSLQTYINLQFNFDYFYSFLESVVKEINGVSYKITSFVSNGIDQVSKTSKEFTDKLIACVNNPISVECMPDAIEQIERYNELVQKLARYKDLLESGFTGIGDALNEIEIKNNKIEELQSKIGELLEKKEENEALLNEDRNKLYHTYNNVDRDIILDRIEFTQKYIDKLQAKIDEYNQEKSQLEQELADLRSQYGSIIDRYNELKQLYETLSNEFNALNEALLRQSQEIIDQVNEEITAAGESVDFEKIKLLDIHLNSGQMEMETKTEQDRVRRSENLQDLYKNVDGAISYVDYNSDVNKNNFNILKDTLSQISRETNNRDIKNRAEESLSLITMDKNIDANVDAINDVETKYNAVISDYKMSTDSLSELIKDDYDSFLVAISDNDTSLVSDKALNLTLSANLFNMDKDTVNLLSNQEGRIKKYMDYNVKNLQGYLNALENHSAETLNMSDEEYNLSKSYLKNVKALSDTVYNIIDDGGKIDGNRVLLAQSIGGNNGGSSSSETSSYNIDIANYIEGRFINTKEGNFLLANEDYVKKFQSNFVLTDINGDNRSDLILWDKNNVYIKYRKDNSVYDNVEYNSVYYKYNIESYDRLVSQADNQGYVKIKNMYVKLVDQNREVKNFKYAGETFDTIKVSWSNNSILGDSVDGYLVKMIHRVDQFNDKESLISQGNNRELFDKKYVLVLPKGAQVSGSNLELEEGVLSDIERWIGTGNKIFGLWYYNNLDKVINLTITDIPRNWQYSEIYTLNFENNTYKITSSSSNQVVAGPQIIADDEGPNPNVKLYRPATHEVVSEGTSLQGYVGTNYILQIDWEDNVAMDEMWISDEYGELLVNVDNVYSETGYIELTGLYFTGNQSLVYYVGGMDIQGNTYNTDINLSIKKPSIEIKNILKGVQNLNYLNGIIGYSPSNNFGGLSSFSSGETVVTVVAELEHDIDSGVVQFLRNRTVDKWELLTGIVGNNVSNLSVSSFQVEPLMTEVYGGNFSLGDTIGLYSTRGELIATLDPVNGKITLSPGYSSDTIELDYSSRTPIVKVREGDKVIFWIIFPTEEFVGIDVYSSDLSIETLEDESFGEFNGGKVVIRNQEALLYVSPKGQIYVESPFLYGEYSFDEATQSVKYTFSSAGVALGAVKVKIKNLLE